MSMDLSSFVSSSSSPLPPPSPPFPFCSPLEERVHKKRSARRAVIVGINYVCSPEIMLRGACNDACAMACTLVMMWNFDPSDIVLLVDSFPASAYSVRRDPHSNLPYDEDLEYQCPGHFMFYNSRQPTRRNILLALDWLRSDTEAGDERIFYFAGHGIQLDDMSGWEGEGVDEAILPMDFYGDEVNGITAVMLRNVLLSVSQDVQVTVILDCNGCQTLLDPTGTGTWSFIKGVKQRGVWPFVTDVTDKVSESVYNTESWVNPVMKRAGTLPRFIPSAEVSSIKALVDPGLQKMETHPGTRIKGYLFAAAPWGQCALELQLATLSFPCIDTNGNILFHPRNSAHMGEPTLSYHGVFTWCFLIALSELTLLACKEKKVSVTFHDVITTLNQHLQNCSRKTFSSKITQKPELTVYRPAACSPHDSFLSRPSRSHCREGSTLDEIFGYPPPLSAYLSVWEAEEQLEMNTKTRQDVDFSNYKKDYSSVSYYEDTSLSQHCSFPSPSTKPTLPLISNSLGFSQRIH